MLNEEIFRVMKKDIVIFPTSSKVSGKPVVAPINIWLKLIEMFALTSAVYYIVDHFRGLNQKVSEVYISHPTNGQFNFKKCWGWR